MIKDYSFCHVYYPFRCCTAYRSNGDYACIQCRHYDIESDYFCDRCGELLDDVELSPTAPHLCAKCRKEVNQNAEPIEKNGNW